MSFIEGRAGRGGWFAALAIVALVGFTPTLAPRPAVAAAYVDAGTPDLKPEERAAVAYPQPVRLLFQFETKGALNGAATKAFKAKLLESVKAGGAVSDVGEAPEPNGAVPSAVTNNYASQSPVGAPSSAAKHAGRHPLDLALSRRPRLATLLAAPAVKLSPAAVGAFTPAPSAPSAWTGRSPCAPAFRPTWAARSPNSLETPWRPT